jgi:hypothetical protein
MKILMVLTSHDKLGNTGRNTGFWLEEFLHRFPPFPGLPWRKRASVRHPAVDEPRVVFVSRCSARRSHRPEQVAAACRSQRAVDLGLRAHVEVTDALSASGHWETWLGWREVAELSVKRPCSGPPRIPDRFRCRHSPSLRPRSAAWGRLPPFCNRRAPYTTYTIGTAR